MSVPPTSGSVDVTVVIPVRDRARQLETALMSVRQQTRPPSRVIVVDDGSVDDSADVAKRLGADVIQNTGPHGSGPARNEGVRAARSRWIAFLDSDDVWLPTHLERVMAQADGFSLVSSAALDSTGRLRGNVRHRPLKLTPGRCFVPENPVVTSTVVVDRAAVMEAGLFHPLDRAQDLDLWVRVVERSAGVVLPAVTARYHVRQEWPTRCSAEQEEHFLLAVVRAYQDRPWMTRGLHRGIKARMYWDSMRLAQHEGRPRDALSAGSWFLRHPEALPALARTLQDRQRARSGGHVVSSTV